MLGDGNENVDIKNFQIVMSDRFVFENCVVLSIEFCVLWFFVEFDFVFVILFVDRNNSVIGVKGYIVVDDRIFVKLIVQFYL